jgi:hypothetical protein
MEDMEGKLHEAIPRARAVEAQEGPEATVLAHEFTCSYISQWQI